MSSRRILRHLILAIVAMLLAATTGVTRAQDDPDGWKAPIAPSRLIGPVHYVGTRGLAAYLIATPAGHILIDGGLPMAGPLILESIQTLGFDMRDVKLLLTTQAHFDHVGSLAHLKRTTGARLLVMQGDEELLASGGRSDYLFGTDPRYQFPAVTADQVIQDGHTISLGGVSLKALRTPGHTPGTATYTTTVSDGGRAYRVVFAGSTFVNPGTRLVNNPSYPGILEDYRTALRVQERLRPEVFFAAHGSQFDFEAKRARAASAGAVAWVDPASFHEAVAASKARLDELVAAER